MLHCYYLFIWLSPLLFPELLRFLPPSTAKRYLDKSPRPSKLSDGTAFLQSLFYHCLAFDTANRPLLYFFLRCGHKNGASFLGIQKRLSLDIGLRWHRAESSLYHMLFILPAPCPHTSPPTVPIAEWSPCIVLCDSASEKLYSGGPRRGKEQRQKQNHHI